MTHVATLVCNPAAPVLTDALLRRAGEILPNPGAPLWLDPGVAADIAFTPRQPADLIRLSDRLRAALTDERVDIIAQAKRGRRKKLLLADMDSTMIGQECIDELAAEIGLRDHVTAITERAMRGEIAFEPALRERVALLKGLDAAIIAKVIATRITLTPGGPALVRTMRAHGAHTALISGGFRIFTAKVAQAIGFDEDRANELVLGADGRLAGLVAEPVLGKTAKRDALRQLREERALTAEETLAVGDGANDLAMIEEAGLGVAYRAKAKLAAAAHARIEHGDLTALLYAQGYRREDFVLEPDHC